MKSRIDTNLSISGESDSWVHSACILCSNGCGMDIAVKDGKIVGVRGIAAHPVNFGHLGPKGEHAWVANHTKKRGTTPMIRRTRDSALEPVSWTEAMNFFCGKIQRCPAAGASEPGLLQLRPAHGRLWVLADTDRWFGISRSACTPDAYLAALPR